LLRHGWKRFLFSIVDRPHGWVVCPACLLRLSNYFLIDCGGVNDTRGGFSSSLFRHFVILWGDFLPLFSDTTWFFGYVSCLFFA
jgi:hypothetical protein